MNLSFVIPCYHSEKTIENVVDELLDALKKEHIRSYEIVLVNDGSLDNTYDVLKRLSREHKNILAINLSRNFGQHAAIMAGLQFVTGDIIICLDDDGQTPASEFKKLVDLINDNCDIVFASYSQKKHSFLRNVGTFLNNKMAEYLINKPKGLSISSYFAMKRFLSDEIIRYENPYPYISGLLIQSTNKIANVSIKHLDRRVGNSNYSFIKLLQLWLNGFTSFSVKPLRIASVFGFFLAITGFIFALIIVVKKLTNPNLVLGYASIMSVLLIIGGALMVMLGIIGEYLGRMYIGFNKTPQYVIKEKHGHDPRTLHS